MHITIPYTPRPQQAELHKNNNMFDKKDNFEDFDNLFEKSEDEDKTVIIEKWINDVQKLHIMPFIKKGKNIIKLYK